MPTGAVPWVSPYPTNALFGEADTSAERLPQYLLLVADRWQAPFLLFLLLSLLPKQKGKNQLGLTKYAECIPAQTSPAT